ncbi:MAG TPA: DUF1232 domain-containing protein [bacterium]
MKNTIETASPPPESRARMKYVERSRSLLALFKTEIQVYRLVMRHPLTPRISRIILSIAIAYAISPIDLIPDFIPVLGHLDDLLILPLLVWTARRTIPEEVVMECRRQVDGNRNGQPGVVADGSGLSRAVRGTARAIPSRG